MSIEEEYKRFIAGFLIHAKASGTLVSHVERKTVVQEKLSKPLERISMKTLSEQVEHLLLRLSAYKEMQSDKRLRRARTKLKNLEPILEFARSTAEILEASKEIEIDHVCRVCHTVTQNTYSMDINVEALALWNSPQERK